MATVRKSDYYITKIPTLDKLTNVVVDNLFGSDRSSRGPSVCLSGTSLSAGQWVGTSHASACFNQRPYIHLALP